MSASYTNNTFQKDLQKLEEIMNSNNKKKNNKKKNMKEQNGGNDDDAKMDEDKRYFKIVELDGQVVNFGRLSIRKLTKPGRGNPGGKPGPGPLAAAKKALRSISEHLGMSDDKKLKVNVQFMIKEITRSSDSKKIYGPYEGHYKKYTEQEMKEKKKLTGRDYKMEPVVKLIDKKNYKKHIFNKQNNKQNNMNVQKGG